MLEYLKSNTNLKILRKIEKFLNGLEIKTHLTAIKKPRSNYKQAYHLRILDYRSVKVFSEAIPIRDAGKKERLDHIVNNFKQKRLITNREKQEIKKMRKNKEPFDIIALRLNISKTSAWNYG